jgi:hypothetical protein
MPSHADNLKGSGVSALVVVGLVLAAAAAGQPLSRPQRASLAGVTVTATRTDVPGTRQEVLVARVPGFRVPAGSARIKRLVEVDSRLELRLSALTGIGRLPDGRPSPGAVLLTLVNASDDPLELAATDPACCDSLRAWGISGALPRDLGPGETVPVVALTVDELRLSDVIPFSAALETEQRYNWRLDVVWDEVAARVPPSSPPARPDAAGSGGESRPSLTPPSGSLPTRGTVAAPERAPLATVAPPVVGRAQEPAGSAQSPGVGAAAVPTAGRGGVPLPEGAGPAMLAQASRAYLAAEYRTAVAVLDPVGLREPRVRAVALLLRAAARFSLYLEEGSRDETLMVLASEDARACFRLEPNLPVDSRVLSPAVWELIRSARK